MVENLKTFILLTSLVLLFMLIGNLVGGISGMIIAFIIALALNFFGYFYSDKMILKHYRAIEVDQRSAAPLLAIVQGLTKKANIPMPKVYIIPDRVPNAFATGRDYNNSAVAVTEGLLDLLSEDEVEAVLAHEIAHIRHYDMLIGTIAAIFAGAIAMIANFLQFSSFFGSSDNEESHNPIVIFILALILPIAAMVVQMSVSRSREYKADEAAAKITGHPEWLQSALYKLENYNKGGIVNGATQESAHMFIVNPFSGKNISFASLFSTHPSTEDRIDRLEKLKNFR